MINGNAEVLAVVSLTNANTKVKWHECVIRHAAIILCPPKRVVFGSHKTGSHFDCAVCIFARHRAKTIRVLAPIIEGDLGDLDFDRLTMPLCASLKVP